MSHCLLELRYILVSILVHNNTNTLKEYIKVYLTGDTNLTQLIDTCVKISL